MVWGAGKGLTLSLTLSLPLTLPLTLTRTAVERLGAGACGSDGVRAALDAAAGGVGSGAAAGAGGVGSEQLHSELQLLKVRGGRKA